MIEDLTFLEQGKYTEKTDLIRTIAQQLRESTNTHLDAVSGFVAGLRNDESDKEKLFRRRGASEILHDGYVAGCTDIALALIVLARELDIPTRYVETSEEQWLKDPEVNKFQGHIFVDIFVDGQWRTYEPKKGFTEDNDYTMGGRRYVEVGKGLDFAEVYMKENGIYRSTPTNLQRLGEAIRLFNPQSPLTVNRAYWI